MIKILTYIFTFLILANCSNKTTYSGKLLNQDELTNKISEIKKLINEYQKFKNEVNKEISMKKKKFSKEILLILNPLLTEYVDIKNINLVIEKKNVLVGVKSLDITNDILKTFNDKTKKMKKIDEN